jgi:hypothetical protein
VTDIVHKDGSVTRRIEIRNSENNFRVADMQVPFDSTWTIRDSLEISVEGDTTWVKRGEKYFENIDLLNAEYLKDSSVNREAERRVEFRRKFRWFNTEYRFAEIAGKKMNHGYPLSDFLNKEELDFFYLPESIIADKKEGPDSLYYRALWDTLNRKTDEWAFNCLVNEWIAGFADLTKNSDDRDISFETLSRNEKRIVGIVKKYDEKFDSLWQTGQVLKEFIGEQGAVKYMAEADSAMNVTLDNFFMTFRDYTQRIVMPGNLISTNGYPDSTNVLLWPVKSDFFLTQQYEMWAESKTTNTWAWMVTGLFVLFVLTGMIIKMIRK